MRLVPPATGGVEDRWVCLLVEHLVAPFAGVEWVGPGDGVERMELRSALGHARRILGDDLIERRRGFLDAVGGSAPGGPSVLDEVVEAVTAGRLTESADETSLHELREALQRAHVASLTASELDELVSAPRRASEELRSLRLEADRLRSELADREVAHEIDLGR